jgi:CelD/BcsL family acetyltransferase involved in cellulose biosynthesis
MDVARITMIDQLDAERGRWETLERLDPHATIFTSWRWLRAYLPIARRRWSILVLRDGAEAVAYLPIARDGSVFDRELYLGGNPYADYTGMIAHPAHEEAAVARFAAALAGERWDAFNMCETDVTHCHSVALPPTWEEYVAQKISAKTRVNTLRVASSDCRSVCT